MRMIKWLIVLTLLLCGTAFADNTGEQDPASSAQEASPGTAWTNIDSVFASDNQRASYIGTTADSLYITNFTMGVTAGATIDSIWVTLEAQGSASQSNRRRFKVFLTKDGTNDVGESVNFSHAQNTDDVIRLTGATTPLWNTTWTAAEVNATTFGIVLWKSASQAGTLLLDHATLYVAFTVGGPAGTSQVIMLEG